MPTLKLLQTNTPDLIVQVKFYNELYNFIIDTGANKTCISKYLFDKLVSQQKDYNTIFRSIEERKYHGVGGIEITQRVKLSLNFFGKIITHVTIGHFLDEWNKSIYSVEEHDGLLGQDVLKQFKKVVIDNEKGEINFL